MSNKRRLAGKHLANKVLAHIRGVRESQRAIAAQLIEHMNSETGACFPSMRLLADELRYSLPTIQIGIAALTDPNDPDRLFDNLNPGQGKLPDYQPRWERFEELNAEIEARYLCNTVKRRANSTRQRTVRSAVNSNCMARAAVTVQDSANKTNLRTKGARPAAPQAAGPVRAPSNTAVETILEAIHGSSSEASGAGLESLSMPGRFLEQKADTSETASQGPPSCLDGASPPSARTPQSTSSSSGPLPRHIEAIASSAVRNGRKPVLPPINDQALYNRLTKRSPQ